MYLGNMVEKSEYKMLTKPLVSLEEAMFSELADLISIDVRFIVMHDINWNWTYFYKGWLKYMYLT